jgi:MarR-like DNA-binding transcriptional regulator SgrR of sgrS sRNA
LALVEVDFSLNKIQNTNNTEIKHHWAQEGEDYQWKFVIQIN